MTQTPLTNVTVHPNFLTPKPKYTAHPRSQGRSDTRPGTRCVLGPVLNRRRRDYQMSDVHTQSLSPSPHGPCSPNPGPFQKTHLPNTRKSNNRTQTLVATSTMPSVDADCGRDNAWPRVQTVRKAAKPRRFTWLRNYNIEEPVVVTKIEVPPPPPPLSPHVVLELLSDALGCAACIAGAAGAVCAAAAPRTAAGPHAQLPPPRPPGLGARPPPP
eukprot:2929597-Rhodomonas_salina.2